MENSCWRNTKRLEVSNSGVEVWPIRLVSADALSRNNDIEHEI